MAKTDWVRLCFFKGTTLHYKTPIHYTNYSTHCSAKYLPPTSLENFFWSNLSNDDTWRKDASGWNVQTALRCFFSSRSFLEINTFLVLNWLMFIHDEACIEKVWPAEFGVLQWQNAPGDNCCTTTRRGEESESGYSSTEWLEHMFCVWGRETGDSMRMRICWEDGTTFLPLEKGIVLLSMDSTNAIIISDIGSEKKTCREGEWAEEGEELRSFWGEQERERTSQKESEEKKCSEID